MTVQANDASGASQKVAQSWRNTVFNTDNHPEDQ